MTMAWAMDLPQGQKMVLLALADRANDDGECWPGQESLSRKCSMSERAIRDNIHKLEQAGLIEVETRQDTDTHQRKTNLYRLNLEQKPPADSAGGSGQKATGSHRQIATKPPAESAGSIYEETSVKAFTRDTAPDAPARKATRSNTVRLLNGRFDIEPDTEDVWKQTYPRIDLKHEIAKAESWMAANPNKRRKNLHAFLVNWFSRADGDAAERGVSQIKPASAERDSQCQSYHPVTGQRCACQASVWKGRRGLCQHHGMDEAWGWEQMDTRVAA